MPEIQLPTKRDVAKVALLASAALGTVVASRYLGTRKISAAERLAESLLDVGRVPEMARDMPQATETVLAACAAYLIGAAYRASEGLGVASGAEDPVGFSRTLTHPYTHAAVTVLTEATSPEPILTYAVRIPDVGEVRGTRRIGPLRLAGLSLARPTPDTAQITLANGYTAQLESEFEVAEYLVAGRTRLFGTATLRDNRDNVGRVHLGYDGAVSGTITREGRVIGRFEGQLQNGVNFKQYQIPPGDKGE
ncbi:MAG TPA: hypothetical protein VFB38_03560 [Chthonomonadaceae bacterium]|nr:hypothetical protein [Chthonomonadaceae bacterium]